MALRGSLQELRLLGLLLALTPLSAVVVPGPSPHPDSAIIPSHAIGPFRLGMRATEVQRLRRAAPCAVTPTYEHERVTRLETNCGGAYRTPEAVQVGDGRERIAAAYGPPANRTDSSFGGFRGEWLHYRTGIAFRVVYGDNATGGLIQAIAVFKGSERYRMRPAPPVQEPGPLPLPSPGGD